MKPTMSETSPNGNPDPKTQLTLFAEASPANPLVSPASAKLKTMSGGCGLSSPEFLASFDPDTWLLKTSQACVVEGWQTFSETFPKSGTMRSGRVYRLPTLAHHIGENGFGLLPTPTATDYKDTGDPRKIAALLDNYQPRLTRIIASRHGLIPTPNFYEWMMGYAIGHTGFAPSGTQSSPNAPTKSSKP